MGEVVHLRATHEADLREAKRKAFLLKCLEYEAKTIRDDLPNLQGEDLRMACILLSAKGFLLERIRGTEDGAFTESLMELVLDYLAGLCKIADSM